MTTIHLLIEDDYIETFMQNLPKDKVVVIEEDFKQNKEKLQEALDEYEEHKSVFIPFYDSMKSIGTWLAEKEIK